MKGPQVTAVTGFMVSVGMPCPYLYRNRLSAKHKYRAARPGDSVPCSAPRTGFTPDWPGASTRRSSRVVQAPDHQQRPERAFLIPTFSAARSDPEGVRTCSSRAGAMIVLLALAVAGTGWLRVEYLKTSLHQSKPRSSLGRTLRMAGYGRVDTNGRRQPALRHIRRFYERAVAVDRPRSVIA